MNIYREKQSISIGSMNMVLNEVIDPTSHMDMTGSQQFIGPQLWRSSDSCGLCFVPTTWFSQFLSLFDQQIFFFAKIDQQIIANYFFDIWSHPCVILTDWVSFLIIYTLL